MIHDYSSHSPVFFDFETQSPVELKKTGGLIYSLSPDTRVLSLSCLIDRKLIVWLPLMVGKNLPKVTLPEKYRTLYDELLLYANETLPVEIEQAVRQERTFVAHNMAHFDYHIWANCVTARGYGPLPSRWGDTLFLARIAGLPVGGLDTIAQQMLGVEKDSAKRIVMPLTQAEYVNGECRYPPVLPGQVEPLVRYCSVDTLILPLLWEKFTDVRVEQDIIQEHQNINERGIAVDLSLAARISEVSAYASEQAGKEIERLTKGEIHGERPDHPDKKERKSNLRSTQQMHAWLEKNGVRITDHTGEKLTLRKEAVERCLANPLLMLSRDSEYTINVTKKVDDIPPEVFEVLRLRSVANRITSAKTDRMGDRRSTDGRIRDLFTYHKAHCVSGETEVLTRNGWVRIDQWRGGDIAQWFPISGHIQFLDATNTRFKNTLPTVIADGPYVSGVFTLGHTVPTYNTVHKFTPRKAGEMPEVNNGKIPISGTLTDTGSINVEQMRVLVAVQADGHWCTDSSQGRGLQIFVKRPRKIIRAREILTAAGIRFRESTFDSHPGFVRFSIRWDDCPIWLTPDRKIFGPWLLDSTPEAREVVITEMQLWDGSQARPNGNASYASKLDINHEWMAVIAHLTSHGMMQRSMQSILRITDRANTRPEHWRLGPVIEDVYCPTTQSGYWVYRHNGVIGITGNTGRWSSSGVQIHNLPRGKKGIPLAKLLRIYEAGQWPNDTAEAYRLVESLLPVEKDGTRKLTVDDALSAMIRPCFTAGEKNKLCIVDYAAIECRGVAWLAGEQKLLDQYLQGEDVYCNMAKILYGREIDPKKDKDERQLGKIVILACGYGMGPEKFAITCGLYGIDLRKLGLTAERCVDTYRAAYPAIAGHYAGSINGRAYRRGGFWDQLNIAAMNAVNYGGMYRVGKIAYYYHNRNLHCILPSGRELRYFNCRMEDRVPGYVVAMNLERKTKPTLVYESQYGSEAVLYGGKLAENVTQASMRDVLACAAVRCAERNIPFIGTVHDEALHECNKSIAEENLHRMAAGMSEPFDWSQGLPIGVEGYTSRRYVKEPLKGELKVEYLNGKCIKAKHVEE